MLPSFFRPRMVGINPKSRRGAGSAPDAEDRVTTVRHQKLCPLKQGTSGTRPEAFVFEATVRRPYRPPTSASMLERQFRRAAESRAVPSQHPDPVLLGWAPCRFHSDKDGPSRNGDLHPFCRNRERNWFWTNGTGRHPGCHCPRVSAVQLLDDPTNEQASLSWSRAMS